MDRTVNDSFKFNRESEFTPILGLVEAELNGGKEETSDKQRGASSIQNNHHSGLLAELAKDLSVAPEEIHDFELWVHLF